MNWLEHNIEERKVMLQQVADSIHLPDYAVEKDWWVTMALKALFETDCAPYLEKKPSLIGFCTRRSWSTDGNSIMSRMPITTRTIRHTLP